MPDIIQEQAPIDILPTERGGTSTSLTPPADEDQSLGQHIEDFHAEAAPEPQKADATAQPQQPKPRHRAAKDRARPEDVPRIKELSAEVKEWKAKYEEAMKDKPYPPAAADRITREIVAARPLSDSTPGPVPEKFTFTTFEQYVKDHPEIQPADAWDAWEADKLDARDAWKDARSQFTAATKQQQDAEQQEIAAIQERGNNYVKQLNAYTKEHPDRAPAFQNIPNVPPLMLEAIWAMENAPDVVYTLLTSPGMFQETHLLLDGKPVTQQNVAAATKWLEARVKAGTTVAATRTNNSPPAARPPTTVRTTPMLPPSAPPGESSSLLEHNSYYKTARR